MTDVSNDHGTTGPGPSNFRLAWIVSQHERANFWIGWVLWAVFFSLPAAIGWILSQAFEALDRGDTSGVYRWIGALALTEAFRMVVVHAGAITYTKAWVHQQSFLRANLLAAQMSSGGAEAGQPVGSAGEAVTHFRDDTEDVAQFIDNLVDVSGGISFAVFALVLLTSANPIGAVAVVVPLALVTVISRLLGNRVRAYRRADRDATAAVTQLVGDTMAAATTVKVNGASDAVLARLQGRVDRRQETAVRDRVLTETIWTTGRAATDVALGLVFVVGAGAIASGSFTVGQLALFVALLGWLDFLPLIIGMMLASNKQVSISFDRMRRLVAEADVNNTVRPRQLPINRRQTRVRPAVDRPDRVRLERLDVRDLAAAYPSGAGVEPVSFTAERGDFVVITGPVGAGKSTLLRALLGLAWQADVTGEVRWNDTPIDERGAFFIPPNAAFLPQVPQLVSDSLADNIAFGNFDDERLLWALSLAELDDDVASMPDGTATLIGPRGLRLSGGQRQRLAAARAVVHRPELVVLDDLSSALDVETELRLWENMAAAGLTVIAVSHRSVAFDRATRVVELGGTAGGFSSSDAADAS